MEITRKFTVLIKYDAPWWIGWVEEMPGVNSQGATREELMENLRSALSEAIAFHREEALVAAQSGFSEEILVL